MRASVRIGLVVAGWYAARMLFGGKRPDDAAPVDNEQPLAFPADGLDKTELAILDWRVDNLTRAGFDELRANTLAAVGDWRRAIDLVEQGCDHLTAAEICL